MNVRHRLTKIDLLVLEDPPAGLRAAEALLAELEPGRPEYARALATLGMAWRGTGAYEKAAEAYSEARSICRRQRSAEDVAVARQAVLDEADVLHRQACLRSAQELFSEAEQDLAEAERIFLAAEDDFHLALVWHSRGWFHLADSPGTRRRRIRTR